MPFILRRVKIPASKGSITQRTFRLTCCVNAFSFISMHHSGDADIDDKDLEKVKQ